MTVDTIDPSIFDAGLPTIAYDDAHDPDEAHRIIRQAREQAPDRAGPARARGAHLRPGAHRAARPPLRHAARASAWPRRASPPARCGTRSARAALSLDGASTTGCADSCPRHSPRGPPSGCARSCVDVITELVDPLTAAGRCDVVADIARPLPDSDHLRAARRTARGLATVLATGPRHHQGLRLERRRGRARHRGGMGATRGLRRRDGRPPAPIPHRRPDLRADPRRRRRRPTHPRRAAHARRHPAHAGTDTTRNQLAAAVEVLVRPPRPVGAAGRASRTGAATRSRS